jgi:hypothetical protein
MAGLDSETASRSPQELSASKVLPGISKEQFLAILVISEKGGER